MEFGDILRAMWSEILYFCVASQLSTRGPASVYFRHESTISFSVTFMRILKFSDLESRPDKDTERVLWNESWERDLKANYAVIRRKGGILSPPGPLDQVGLVEPSKVCQLQQDLCEYAVRHLTNDKFAEKWKGHPREQRDEVLLEALFQACAVENLESHRVWCPEMTIAYLGGNGGRGLLGLLLESLPEDIEQAFLEPKFVSHPEVDHLLQYKQFSASAARIKLQRAHFMTTVLLHTLLSFVGGRLFLNIFIPLMYIYCVFSTARLRNTNLPSYQHRHHQ